MSEVQTAQIKTTENSAKIVYVLYLVGILFPLTGIIGVVMAYINQNDAPEWLKSHYQFQIRTFWIGALYMFIGAVLAILLIGYLVLLFWVIWLIVRSIKGLTVLNKNEAHPNPTGWMF